MPHPEPIAECPDAERGFEIRVSPDQRDIAIYDPGNSPWFVPVRNMRGRFVPTAAVKEWTPYAPTDPDTVAMPREHLDAITAALDRMADEFADPVGRSEAAAAENVLAARDWARAQQEN